jgi:hypothetical protein
MSEILLNDFNNIYPLEKDLPQNKLNEQTNVLFSWCNIPKLRSEKFDRFDSKPILFTAYYY